MLTASEPVHLRIALLRASPSHALGTGALSKLLRDRGHRVDISDSVAELSRLSKDVPLDLLVVDSTLSGTEATYLEDLAAVHWTTPPREVAVLSDSENLSVRDLRARLRRSAVHLFLKPLHLHGLLRVLRKAEEALVAHP